MFFCLISYHKANVILNFINCSTMLKARKITVESCSMHGPGRQHHIWRWGLSGMEYGNMGPMTCQEKKILRESWKLLLCTWRCILWRRDYQGHFVIFPVCLWRAQSGSVEFNSTSVHWFSIVFQALDLEFRAKWTRKTQYLHSLILEPSWETSTRLLVNTF